MGDWYDKKFTEMGGSWYVPPDEINGLLDKMGYPQDAKYTMLLELGCGDGKLLYEALKRGGTVVGTDISYVARKMADEKLREFSGMYILDPNPMESLNWEDNSFDYVISYGSMEHALDIQQATNELARVLKSGGRWLNYAPNEEWIHMDQPLETTMTASEWQAIYDTAGLVVESITKNGDNTIYVGTKL